MRRDHDFLRVCARGGRDLLAENGLVLVARVRAARRERGQHTAPRLIRLRLALRDGGDFGAVALDRFNGGLFATVDAIPLTGDELATLAEAGHLDWASVEPAIFGTLFERSLDPSQRAQLGAHYTGRADIERVK